MKRFKHRRNPEYTDWIRSLPCLLCGGTAEVAHVRSRGAGGDDIGNTVPLCHAHHRQQHQVGIKSFQLQWGVDLQAHANWYADQWGDCGGTTETAGDDPTDAGEGRGTLAVGGDQ